MEQRDLKISFNKSGGTASKGGFTARVTIPTKWVKELGISDTSREIIATLVDDKIIIMKKEQIDMENQIEEAYELGKKLGKELKIAKKENIIHDFIYKMNSMTKYDAIDKLILICLQYNVDAKILILNLKSDDSTRSKLISATINGAQKILLK